MTARGAASTGRIESKRPAGLSSRATTATSAVALSPSSASAMLSAPSSLPAPKAKDIFALVAERKRAEDEKGDEKGARESTVIFLGPRQCGKTTVASTLNQAAKDEVPMATAALDYKGVQSRSGIDETRLTHLWELGGGRAMVSLADISFAPETLKQTMTVVVVDLSKPWRVVSDALFWLNIIRTHCMRYRSASPDGYLKLEQEAQRRFGETHKDLASCEIIPLNVLLVGSKFDTFKDKDAELLKVMSRTLRAICHSNGAGLLYFSKKYQSLATAMRTRIERHLLNKAPSKSAPMVDHTKPLAIHAGCDSFELIGEPSGKTPTGPTTSAWITQFARYFPTPADERDEEDGGALPEVTPAPEAVVDTALAQKEETLRRLQREKEAKRNAMRGAGAEFKEVRR